MPLTIMEMESILPHFNLGLHIMSEKNNWKTLEGKPIEDIEQAIRDEFNLANSSGGILFAYIGTDSQNLGQKFTAMVQCVALHRHDVNCIGKGGRVFYIRHLEARYVNRQKRLLREAEISIKLAQRLEPLFTELDIPFEVHADVNSVAGENNENKSHDVHDTVKGWIESMGFCCRTKPQAIISSIVADKMTRGTKRSRKFPKVRGR